MRIENSAIFMSSKSSFVQEYRRKESLLYWSGNQRSQPQSDLQSKSIRPDILELSDEAKALLSNSNLSVNGVLDDTVTFELSDKDKHKIMLLQTLIETMTGKKLKFLVPEKLKLNNKELSININNTKANPNSQTVRGWGLQYDFHESYFESQQMSFKSEGTVQTSDGREISFSVELAMSRQFYSEKNISIRAGDAVKIDPLLINFDGAIPQLTDEKFSFDIDSDGKSKQISFASSGSGFLALDLNSDGIINNGGELFGPKTGDGFLELAVYDDDSNNWIDENDEIYDKLRIWTKDEQGNDVLFALGQKGAGAIFLGNVSTLFELKNQENTLNGSISQTGIYLKEDGTAGTIQHIDLAV